MDALAGLRVLDFTHYIAGPHCSQILADHGAEVIKMEALEGEACRNILPIFDDESLYFTAQNRNKKAFSIDLKVPESQEILRKLIETSDIIVTNYGTGVPDRLGFGYEEASRINPGIVMVQITGFGLTGPYKDYAAFDGIIQAMSGLADLTGQEDGPPSNVGFYIADHISGVQAALGAMIAIQERHHTGKGRYVDISMLDGLISLLGHYPGDVIHSGENRTRVGNSDRRAFASIFPTTNGYIYISVATQKLWENFANLLGRKEWVGDDSKYNTRAARIKYRKEIEEEISNWTKQFTKEEVFSYLQEHKISSGPVASLSDIVQDPQVKERSMIQMVRTPNGNQQFVPGTPIKFQGDSEQREMKVPGIGQHTNEILEELGFNSGEIEKFKHAGVL